MQMAERRTAEEQRTSPDAYPTRGPAALPASERHDPVVYGRWAPGAPLTREQTESFERNGFLVLESVFGVDEVAALRAEIDPEKFDPETLVREPGSEALRSIFRIHAQNALYARLAVDARVAGIVRFLLDDEVYIHQSRLNLKPGLRGKGFYWHSDFETWHAEDGMPAMRCISASVLLTDNMPYNGALMFIPGSHRTFVPCPGETPDDHYRVSLRNQEIGVPADGILTELYDSHGLAAATGPAGSVALFDCNLMHGSNSNITPAPRANFFCVYNAVSNRLVTPFGARVPRPEFIATRQSCDAVVPASGSILNARERSDHGSAHG